MEKKPIRKGNAYAQRVITLVLWGLLLYYAVPSMLAGQFGTTSIFLLIALILLHTYEIPKYGIEKGKQHGYSPLYAAFLTFLFGVTWHRTVDSTHRK